MDWQRVPQTWSGSRKIPVAETVIYARDNRVISDELTILSHDLRAVQVTSGQETKTVLLPDDRIWLLLHDRRSLQRLLYARTEYLPSRVVHVSQTGYKTTHWLNAFPTYNEMCLVFDNAFRNLYWSYPYQQPLHTKDLLTLIMLLFILLHFLCTHFCNTLYRVSSNSYTTNTIRPSSSILHPAAAFSTNHSFIFIHLHFHTFTLHFVLLLVKLFDQFFFVFCYHNEIICI